MCDEVDHRLRDMSQVRAAVLLARYKGVNRIWRLARSATHPDWLVDEAMRLDIRIQVGGVVGAPAAAGEEGAPLAAGGMVMVLLLMLPLQLGRMVPLQLLWGVVPLRLQGVVLMVRMMLWWIVRRLLLMLQRGCSCCGGGIDKTLVLVRVYDIAYMGI